MDSDEKLQDTMAGRNILKAQSPDISKEIYIDPAAEKRLVRKLDLILLPMFTLAYCTNFIDRTAIGNAKIAGIEKDLGMSGFDYNVALTVFYIFYISVDIPSNLALKRFGSVWLAGLITSFGIVSIGTAFIRSYAGLIVTRVFLGLAEGGTLSGLTYILSRYYRRSELVLRIGIFFGTSPGLAGAFGGLLASGILSLPDIGTVQSWRKIFLIEGIITTGFGLLCFLIIPADPQYTRMLNEDERALALARIDADQAVRTQGRKEKTTVKLVWRSFSFITALYSLCYLMVNISFQGLSLFLPTVISSLGHYSVVQAQLRTVPPYVTGVVWALICSYYSFRTKQRAIPIVFSYFLTIAGYAIAIGTKHSHARYAACFLSVTGASLIGPMYLAWGTDNAAPDTVRAVTTAIIPGIGALGSVIASVSILFDFTLVLIVMRRVWTYLPSDAPNYHNGNSLNLSTSVAGCVLALVALYYLRWENAKRDRGERDYRLQGKTTDEIQQLGYLHPNFRYQT